jgi:hypothetical protein
LGQILRLERLADLPGLEKRETWGTRNSLPWFAAVGYFLAIGGGFRAIYDCRESMMLETTARELLAGVSDRRRVPRYSCSGQAQIACLPSVSGMLLRGRVRDLGLGGCCIECIETVFPFDLGTQTEILVEVNSWSFRAMGHVRALRERSGISLEFLRMSAGGYSMLADLIADLERPRGGQERLVERSRQLLRGASGVGSVADGGVAIVGTIVPAQSVEEISSGANRQAWVRALHPGARSVDIFV